MTSALDVKSRGAGVCACVFVLIFQPQEKSVRVSREIQIQVQLSTSSGRLDLDCVASDICREPDPLASDSDSGVNSNRRHIPALSNESVRRQVWAVNAYIMWLLSHASASNPLVAATLECGTVAVER